LPLQKIHNARVNVLGLPSLRSFLLGAGVLLSTVSGVRGQTEASTGVISGTVRDQAGGILVGSVVQVHHQQTGLARQIGSNADGYFRFSLLPLGDYVLEASSKGFAALKRTGINLRVGQELVINLEMQVASVGQTVSVDALAPAVETARYDRTQVLDNRAI